MNNDASFINNINTLEITNKHITLNSNTTVNNNLNVNQNINVSDTLNVYNNYMYLIHLILLKMLVSPLILMLLII